LAVSGFGAWQTNGGFGFLQLAGSPISMPGENKGLVRIRRFFMPAYAWRLSRGPYDRDSVGTEGAAFAIGLG
jgi:hypothetical protein